MRRSVLQGRDLTTQFDASEYEVLRAADICECDAMNSRLARAFGPVDRNGAALTDSTT